MTVRSFHLHLVSDSTGETVAFVARAVVAQFDDIEREEHFWTLVRSEVQVADILAEIEKTRGFVLFTLVDPEVRAALEAGCRRLQVPCIPVLDPVVDALGAYLGAEVHARPGRQHSMNAGYFQRIEAIHYVLVHDDGQSAQGLNDADVILVGASRTSKTPTCIYLANRGLKAANIPYVPNCPLPPELLAADRPLIVGLTKDAKQLVAIRRNRLRLLNQTEETDYVDLETVTREITAARKLFAERGWPVIDVTRKSIEEVAATVIQLHSRHKGDHI